jgi:hypothetical protein
MERIKEKFKEHSTIYTILLIPIIGVFLFVIYLTVVFGVINYADRQPFDKEAERIANITPFSQRGLPVPATDVPVTLPPDPGEAGKATLAGIDSDHDGVRDDLEREIVYMYPQNQEARRVLTAMVKKIQDVITTTGDHEHFKGLMESAFAFKNCYIYIVFPENTFDPTNDEILWHMAINTKERKNTEEVNENKATPFSSVAGGSSYSCEILKGQY